MHQTGDCASPKIEGKYLPFDLMYERRTPKVHCALKLLKQVLYLYRWVQQGQSPVRKLINYLLINWQLSKSEILTQSWSHKSWIKSTTSPVVHKVRGWVNLWSVLLLYNHTSSYFWCHHFQLPAILPPVEGRPYAQDKHSIRGWQAQLWKSNKIIRASQSLCSFLCLTSSTIISLSDDLYKVYQEKRCLRMFFVCYFKIGLQTSESVHHKSNYRNEDCKLQSSSTDWTICETHAEISKPSWIRVYSLFKGKANNLFKCSWSCLRVKEIDGIKRRQNQWVCQKNSNHNTFTNRSAVFSKDSTHTTVPILPELYRKVALIGEYNTTYTRTE